MSYEIPQQLEYKEKIMFGLTFKQLSYLFLFGFLDLAFLKKGFSVPVLWSLLMLNSSIGMGFVFFDFSGRIKIFWNYMKFKGLVEDSKKLKKFMGIKKITEDHIINEDNKKIAILKVMPINLSIKADEEQEVVFMGFRKFLNSLDFPIQIVMNTEEINLNSYLENKQYNKEKKIYRKLAEDNTKFLKNTIKENSINNRGFYVVIPEATNLENQVNICKNRLNSLHLKVRQLSKNETISLLKKYFRSNGKNKENLLDDLSPSVVINNNKHIKINDMFCRVVCATGYPRTVDGGFLDRIVSCTGNFDLSIHIEPFNIESMMVTLNRELQKQRADLHSDELKNRINPSLEIQYKDTRRVLEELQKGKEKLMQVSLYICCKAKTIEELTLLSEKVKAELNSILIIPKVYSLRQAESFRSCLPLVIDNLKEQRNVTSTSLSAFFPFTSPFLQIDETGVWLGLNKNKIPIIRDIFKLSNPNGVILSQSGGGKSFFSKLLISRYLLNGTKVLVIDPQGEYTGLVEQFEGERIVLSKDSESIINPLDLMTHDYINKRLSLMDLMKVMLGDLTEPQRAIIDKAITMTYKDFGYDTDKVGTKMPILKDLKIRLERLNKRATSLEKPTITSILNRLEMYVSGVFSFLNKETKINFNNNFVCFDISQLPKQVKPVLMYLVLDFVYCKMKEDLERKILLVDEAWTLLSRSEDASYIFEIVKTSRKFNMGLLLINQEVEGLLDSKAGKSVLANSAYTLLLKQKPSVIKQVVNTFHLSNTEKEILLSSDVGQGILIMDEEHSEISIVASDKEKEIITTNADEIKARIEKEQEQKKKEPKVVESNKINSSEDRICLPYSKANKQQREHLLEQGYKVYKYNNPFGKKQEKFIVKEKLTEKRVHIIVNYLVAEFLKKLECKVKLFSTVEADIIFTTKKNKKFVLEIETGTVTTTRKEVLVNKVESLNKKYGNNWFFIVTDKNKESHYTKLGTVIRLSTLKTKLNKLATQ